MTNPSPRRSWDLVAGFYEAGGGLYSLGQIGRSKRAQAPYLGPGVEALFLGVGAGEDALAAARRAVRLTCVDLAPKMLDRLARRLRAEGLAAELVVGDAREHRRQEGYDVVAANYFLNMFVEPDLAAMLAHAASLVRPGGRLLIADVAPPPAGLLARAAYHAFLDLGKALACAAGLLQWHPNYDYRRYLEGTDLTVERYELFRLAGVGPAGFQNLVLRKKG